MCGWSEEDLLQRTQIDPALLEPARAIAARIGGEAIPTADWDVFFGRAGGAMSWRNIGIIKASYERAFAIERTRAAFRRKRRQTAMICRELQDA